MAQTASARIPVRDILRTSGECRSCVDLALDGLRRLPGVATSELSAGATEFVLTFRPEQTAEADLRLRAADVGQGVCRRMRHETFAVSGMDCPDCAAQIAVALRRLPGICIAEVNFLTARLTVEYDQERTALEPIASIVRHLGYRLHQGKREVRARAAAGGRAGLVTAFAGTRGGLRTLLAGVLLLAAAAGEYAAQPRPAVLAFYLLSLLVSGLPIAVRGAFRTVATRSFDMYGLMTLACAGAAAIGDWPEAATAMCLFSLGTTLETFTFERARGSLRSLLDASPARAHARRDGKEVDLPVEEVRVGDVILARPGERIALDGRVVAGRSSVDQAAITGESAPVEKGPGAEVYAGTLNGEGLLEVEVARPAADATLARIVHLVEEAQERRAPSQQMVDRFARWYTPAVICAALLVAAVPAAAGLAAVVWLRRALVLLVISCPCALVISTPVSILAAVASASRNGVLVKGGIHLETLAALRAFVFDKTGTLTRAEPAVTAIVPAEGWTEEEVLGLAAALEAGSEHPVARSLVERARARGLRLAPPEDFRALPGLGARGRVAGREVLLGSRRMLREMGSELPGALAVAAEATEAQGSSPAVLWDAAGVIGLVVFADQVRDQAAEAVRSLRAAGIDPVVMLTGDNERSARAVGEALGITDVRAGLLPQEKVRAVEELLARHGPIAMVGDGVNDAPALARASVGIVMGAIGSDAALETADLCLMSDDLSRLPYLVKLGRATVAVIRQNIAASVLVKGLFFLLALFGWVNLWMAVASDLGVSLLVTLNGMRLFGRGAPAGHPGSLVTPLPCAAGGPGPDHEHNHNHDHGHGHGHEHDCCHHA